MQIVYTLAHTSIHTVIIWHAASAAMVVMVIRLAHRVCWRSTLMAITDGGQYWRALKQLLPLVAFPILFFIFVLPVVMYDQAIVRTSDEAQALIPTFLIPLWSMASGVTLIVHIAVALLCTCNKKTAARWSVMRKNTRDENVARILETYKTDANSTTNFVPPMSSFMEEH